MYKNVKQMYGDVTNSKTRVGQGMMNDLTLLATGYMFDSQDLRSNNIRAGHKNYIFSL